MNRHAPAPPGLNFPDRSLSPGGADRHPPHEIEPQAHRPFLPAIPDDRTPDEGCQRESSPEGESCPPPTRCSVKVVGTIEAHEHGDGKGDADRIPDLDVAQDNHLTDGAAHWEASGSVEEGIAYVRLDVARMCSWMKVRNMKRAGSLECGQRSFALFDIVDGRGVAMWSAPPMSRRCGWRRKTGPLADRSRSWEGLLHLEGDRMFPCTAQAVVGTGQVRSVSFGSAVPVPPEAVGNVRLPRLFGVLFLGCVSSPESRTCLARDFLRGEIAGRSC
jgi:hypothetical protein